MPACSLLHFGQRIRDVTRLPLPAGGKMFDRIRREYSPLQVSDRAPACWLIDIHNSFPFLGFRTGCENLQDLVEGGIKDALERLTLILLRDLQEGGYERGKHARPGYLG